MATKELPSFRDALLSFFCDRLSASPLVQELHWGLVQERDMLCNCIENIAAVDDGEAGLHQVSTQVDSFVQVLQNAAGVIRAQRAPTSHIWADNLFNVIVHRNNSRKGSRRSSATPCIA